MKYLMMICSVAFFFSCDNVMEEFTIEKELDVSTQSRRYELNDPIAVSVMNNSADTITLEVCNRNVFYYRDKLTENGWEEWTQLSCETPLRLHTIQLLPFTKYVDTIVVRKPGTYRFRIPVMKNRSENQMEMLHSNSFSIAQPL